MCKSDYYAIPVLPKGIVPAFCLPRRGSAEPNGRPDDGKLFTADITEALRTLYCYDAIRTVAFYIVPIPVYGYTFREK